MDLLDQLPLKVISIARPAWERSIYMVSDERIYLSPVVRNFQRFVLEQQGGGDGDRAEMLIDSLHGRPRQNEASRAPFSSYPGGQPDHADGQQVSRVKGVKEPFGDPDPRPGGEEDEGSRQQGKGGPVHRVPCRQQGTGVLRAPAHRAGSQNRI